MIPRDAVIELYGRDGCGVCDQAKEFLSRQNINYTYYTIGIDISRDDLLAKLVHDDSKNNRPINLPVVFINRQYIGSYDQLVYAETRGFQRLINMKDQNNEN